MGKMIDALKLLEEKSPKTPRSSPPEATAATVQPVGTPPVAVPPTTVQPLVSEQPPAETSVSVVEPPHMLAVQQPLRLRVYNASEVDATRTLASEETGQSDFPVESQEIPLPVRQRLRWPKIAAQRQQEMEILALRILGQTAQDGPGSLVFTSVGDDGASAAVILGLAPQIAERIGGRVLVVDADAVEAILSRQLGAGAARGLTEVARGEVDWTELVRESDIARLDLLPARAASSTEVGRLDGLDAGRALAEMGMHYAMTLIDAGPAARFDAARLGRYCDGVCLAVRLGEAPKAAVEEAARMLRLAKAHLLGTIAVN